MMLKTGLLPPRPGAVKMKLDDYLTPSLPKRPASFGHASVVRAWNMLGNDKVGCCAWSGAAHETYLWTTLGSQRVRITTADVLHDYADCTGYVIGDGATDRGTDMQAAASYRRKVGIRDSLGRRHTISAYVDVEGGNLEQILTGAWLFDAIGLGVVVGSNSMDQFSRGVPWDGDPGPHAGGHYVPLVSVHDNFAWVVTWGELQPVTMRFLEAHCDQAIAYLSPEMLKNGKSTEGFDLAKLTDDLKLLTA